MSSIIIKSQTFYLKISSFDCKQCIKASFVGLCVCGVLFWSLAANSHCSADSHIYLPMLFISQGETLWLRESYTYSFTGKYGGRNLKEFLHSYSWIAINFDLFEFLHDP